MLASLFWLDALPTGWFLWGGKLLLVWALLSTVLVGTVGAWVALGRSRRRWNQRGF